MPCEETTDFKVYPASDGRKDCQLPIQAGRTHPFTYTNLNSTSTGTAMLYAVLSCSIKPTRIELTEMTTFLAEGVAENASP